MFAITLAGGAWIFAAFIVLFTISVIYSLYTRRGSGINQRPYSNVYDAAQGGAKGSSVLHHDESAATRYTRGTR